MEKLVKNSYVIDLKVKSEVEDIFLVKYVSENSSRDGKSYFNLILADKTGDLESRLWNPSMLKGQVLTKGQHVLVQGKINVYQSRKQFVIKSLEIIDSNHVNRDEFVRQSDFNVDKMYDDLMSLVEGLEDVYIRDLLKEILQDDFIKKELYLMPAGKTVHHAYRGGLLEHILSCAQLSKSLCGHYVLNENFVIAGAILHDICKIYELEGDEVVEYSLEGKLIGHLAKGVELVNKYAYRINHFPKDTLLHLKHIILSHHGEYEFGSPKLPLTQEAMLVHLIDLMDSRMGAFKSIIKQDNTQGAWSGYVKHLDRAIYKNKLPLYRDYKKVTNDGSKVFRNQEQSKKKYNKEIKQNLGSFLKDFQVKDV